MSVSTLLWKAVVVHLPIYNLGAHPAIIGITWYFQNLTFTVEIFICIFYWALLRSGGFDALDIHKHLIVGVMVLIDLFVVANETRYLHVLYMIPAFSLYGVLSLVLHATGVNSAIYPVLDWKNNVTSAALYTCASVFVMPFVVHAIVYGLSVLRKYIYLQCGHGPQVESAPERSNGIDTVSGGKYNEAYNNEEV